MKCFLMLFIAVFVSFVLVGCTFDDTSSNSNSTTQNTIYKMNQSLKVGNLEYNVTSVTDTKKIGDDLLGQETSNNFVIVTITIKNTSSSEKYITDTNFKYYRGSISYESSSAGIYLDGGFYLAEEIGSGLSKVLKVVYEIPSSHQTTDYILARDGFSSEKIYLSGISTSTNNNDTDKKPDIKLPSFPLTLIATTKSYGTVYIEEFKITNARYYSYSNKTQVDYEIKLYCENNNLSCIGFYFVFYDAEGYRLGTSWFWEEASNGEKLKISDDFYMPADTTRIEFIPAD